METQQNSSNIYQLAPGFRFHPTDEELIVHYLRNKVTSLPIQACIVAEVDLYRFNPWDLPIKNYISKKKKRFFFTPRQRKYPNGARPNRKAASGYLKATGKHKPILTSCGSQTIGVKKALVFYKGHPANDTKTNWIMHEYRLITRKHVPAFAGEGTHDRLMPKIAERCSNIINPSPDTVTEYLNNGCPLLAYILAAQEFSRWKCYQGGNVNNNSSTSIHKDIMVLQTTVIEDSCISNLISPLKRKPNEEHANSEYPDQSNRKLNTFNNTFTYGY
ncbi:hypothetical protein MKX01_004353 [Papaver californicum]|nr:hypothetical protein MKX01_004353 [Papaver californicum]